jgi:GT2 family glycosyltransferase
MKPDYSFLIMNFNTLKSLKVQLPILCSFRNISYEIIVVDNGSDDGSVAYIKDNFPGIKLIELRKNIGTAAINSGLKHCEGEYIFFMGDLVFSERDLLVLRKTLDSDTGIGIATPLVFNYFSKKIEFSGELMSRSLYSRSLCFKPRKDLPFDIVGAGVGLIRKKTIKQVGNFIYDPDYFLYGEDIDLGLRIRLIGKRTVLVPGSKIFHAHTTITAKTFSRFYLSFLTERNLTLTFFKTFSRSNLILFFPYVLFTRVLGCLKDLFYLRFQCFFGRLCGFCWFVFHPFFVLDKRRQSQRMRKADDSFVLEPFREKAIFGFLE